MKTKTIKAEYRKFTAECNRLADMLNLRDWCIELKHDDRDFTGKTLGNKQACANINAPARLVSITLNTNRLVSFDPLRVAKHEMAHVLLATMVYIGGCRWAHNDELEMEDERLARVFEKIL